MRARRGRRADRKGGDVCVCVLWRSAQSAQSAQLSEEGTVPWSLLREGAPQAPSVALAPPKTKIPKPLGWFASSSNPTQAHAARATKRPQTCRCPFHCHCATRVPPRPSPRARAPSSRPTYVKPPSLLALLPLQLTRRYLSSPTPRMECKVVTRRSPLAHIAQSPVLTATRSTKSVNQSIFDYVREHGRTYHRYKPGCKPRPPCIPSRKQQLIVL